MKILFVISCLSYGGAEKNLMLVANYLCQKHDVMLCDFNEHKIIQTVSNNIDFYQMNEWACTKKKYDWVYKRIEQYKYLKSICLNKRPDVIVSFLPIPNALSVVCGKKLKIPVIISERADPYQSTSKLDVILHKIYNKADGAVFQTEGAKKFYGKKLQKKSIIIPNPVLIKNNIEEHDYSVQNNEIAFVGRFEIRQKRQDLAIEALRIVKKIYPNVKLIFYGDGPDTDLIKELVNKYNLQESVYFAGAINNVHTSINKSEIFLMTSDYEGIPNALIEAMSIGMPCISTDCSPGGAKLLTQNGQDGILVECGNIDDISNAIIRLFGSENLRKEYGERAKEITDRFSMKHIMDLWDKYISRYEHNL